MNLSPELIGAAITGLVFLIIGFFVGRPIGKSEGKKEGAKEATIEIQAQTQEQSLERITAANQAGAAVEHLDADGVRNAASEDSNNRGRVQRT